MHTNSWGRLRWICPQCDHGVYGCLLTCAFCLEEMPNDELLTEHYKVCKASYLLSKKRRKRTRVWCMQCHRIHTPPELINSPCRGKLSYIKARLLRF